MSKTKGPITQLAEGSTSQAVINMAELIELKLNILVKEHERMNEQIYDLEAKVATLVGAHNTSIARIMELEAKDGECCCDSEIPVQDVQDKVRSDDAQTEVSSVSMPKQVGKDTNTAGKATS